jgi:alpha-mannosidase
MYHKIRWTPEKIAARLKLIEPLAYIRRSALPPFRYRELESPLSDASVGLEVDDSGWQEVHQNEYWGRWMTDFVMRASFQVPEAWDPDAQLALYLPLGEAGDFSHPEALIYIDGAPYAACDRHHQEISLQRSQWKDGQPHLLALHGWTGIGGFARGDPFTRLYMHPCWLVQIDSQTRALIAASRVALDSIESFDLDSPVRAHLLNALDEAYKTLDTREPFGKNFYASVPAALAVLQERLSQAGHPLDVIVHASGHAHIDVAWLWTVAQTRRKAERTFYNVVRLMERFPEYQFTQSQPQLYEFIRQDQPELFEEIRARIVEGRWEPIGGMWVEADCNLSGAESLARQFLLGRTYFREHFGADAEAPILWLPDVFGYTWSLPQLLKSAGLKYFLTTKIGWNQYNRLPYDTFWWQGIDGTRTLTHFSTTPGQGNSYASTYNALATPKDVIGTWKNFQHKELHRDLIMIYGYGDGGGGPTREMLENIRFMKTFPGLPQVIGSSARAFFESLESSIDERLPVWNGELYLEYHRGTYTTHSRNKRANRKSEFKLHDTEFLAVMAALLDEDYHYPAQALREAWRIVCLNQFHDIIPGSSIAPVYEESLAQYDQVGANVDRLQQEALGVIFEKMEADLLVINPTSFTRSDLVLWRGKLSEGLIPTHEGVIIPTQEVAEGTLMALKELPPYSVTPILLAADSILNQPTLMGVNVSPLYLENEYLRVELEASGDIVRIFDKVARREVLAEGAVANQFQAFEDRPKAWDAWDIDIYYDDRMWLAEPAESVRVIDWGPLRATLEIKRRILNSDYTQQISLAYNSRRLDIDTLINWQERHILLKVAFPVEVLSPQATYEIQWGSVQRPTHRNTSWDWARFETCAQKWVDLSEGGYGVSLLNDCKYGHDIQGQVIRLSLLRGTTMPDPGADLGQQRFAYSLFPHLGDLDESTAAASYELNDPLIVFAPQEYPVKSGRIATESIQRSLITSHAPNVILETVKWAEDEHGLIIRLYESQRKRGAVRLSTGFSLAAAWETNLLEENQRALDVEGNGLTLQVRPFQIITLRLLPES